MRQGGLEGGMLVGGMAPLGIPCGIFLSRTRGAPSLQGHRNTLGIIRGNVALAACEDAQERSLPPLTT